MSSSIFTPPDDDGPSQKTKIITIVIMSVITIALVVIANLPDKEKEAKPVLSVDGKEKTE